MQTIDKALFSYGEIYKGYDGNCPTTEEEYNNLISSQTLFDGTPPTWAELQAKVTELDDADAQKATDKANAKAKLIAGEALTEAEADTIVL